MDGQQACNKNYSTAWIPTTVNPTPLKIKTMETFSLSDIHFLDGFSGAGGASLGIKRAGCKVAVAINHDERAIWAHNANHPTTLHLNDDIRKVDIVSLAQRLIAIGIRRINIWWSAECTHFSNAKGGASRDADSRMLSEELIRYVTQLEANGIAVDWVFVENVKEFFSWTALLPRWKSGKRLKADERRYSRIQIEMFDAVASGDHDLKARLAAELDAIYARFQACKAYDMDGDGKITMLPDAATKGLLYLRWTQALKDLGYRYDWKMLNAADFGAYQSRERYFGVFVKQGLAATIDASGKAAIRFPQPTHAKNPKPSGSLFDIRLNPWKPCREILDLDDKGESIFYGRAGRKPLVPATLARIRFGIMKFKGEGTMIDRSNTGASPTDTNDPMPTVRASFQNGVIQVATVDSCTFGQHEVTVNAVMPTVMAKRDKYLMQAFVVPANFSNRAHATTSPLHTLVASRKHQYLCSPFIAQQFGGFGKSNQVASLDAPLWAMTTNPKGSLVIPFLSKYYGNGDNATSLENPCGTVTTKDRLGIAQCSFLNYYYGGGKGNSNARNTSLNSPINTVGCSHSAHAINAQLINTDEAWPITLQLAPKPTDKGNMIIPAWCRIVNGYLVDNRILDIHYRMLKLSELKLAQGFPKDYILDPNSETVAKKHIGNAVHVDCAHALVEINCGPESPYAKQIQLAQNYDCSKVS